MRQRQMVGLLAALLVIAAGAAAWLWPERSRRAGGTAGVELPAAAGGWAARGPTASYDPRTIFDYIDGHAEVYLAYGLRRCLSRRYAGPGGEADIVIDLFELASPADAFGVATYDREGSPAAIGRDGLVRHGWLSFWQGAYFASVLSERETERSQAAVIQLGRTLAAQLPGEGSAPPIVSALPADGLQPREVRFLRHPQILNTHVFVDDENLFGLEPTTGAALGRYVRGESEAYLLLVQYPNAALASRVARTLRGHFGLGDDEDATQVSDRGWFAARARDARLAAAIGAGSRELASTLIRQALDEETGGTP